MRFSIYIFALFVFISSCQQEELQDPPTVITGVPANISLTAATLTGDITNEGYSAVTAKGFVYSSQIRNPSLNDSKVELGTGKGAFAFVLDKLTRNTRYYFKAYATNSKGTKLGEVKSFITSDYLLPSLSTDVPKSIGYSTAFLGGIVANDGGGFVSERGFAVGANPTPTILDLKFTDLSTGIGAYSLFVTTLKESTKYYVRSYAVNQKGISYGNTHIFTTADLALPTVITEKALNISQNAVKMGGNITNDGGSDVVESGICYGLTPNPKLSDLKVISGVALGSFSVAVNDLRENTMYYFRAYAINTKGLTYGNEQSFKTLFAPVIPNSK